LAGSPGSDPGPAEVSPTAVLRGLIWGMSAWFKIGIETALAPERG